MNSKSGTNLRGPCHVKGKVLIDKHTKISDDSLIKGPAIIGDNLRMKSRL